MARKEPSRPGFGGAPRHRHRGTAARRAVDRGSAAAGLHGLPDRTAQAPAVLGHLPGVESAPLVADHELALLGGEGAADDHRGNLGMTRHIRERLCGGPLEALRDDGRRRPLDPDVGVQPEATGRGPDLIGEPLGVSPVAGASQRVKGVACQRPRRPLDLGTDGLRSGPQGVEHLVVDEGVPPVRLGQGLLRADQLLGRSPRLPACPLGHPDGRDHRRPTHGGDHPDSPVVGGVRPAEGAQGVGAGQHGATDDDRDEDVGDGHRPGEAGPCRGRPEDGRMGQRGRQLARRHLPEQSGHEHPEQAQGGVSGQGDAGRPALDHPDEDPGRGARGGRQQDADEPGVPRRHLVVPPLVHRGVGAQDQAEEGGEAPDEIGGAVEPSAPARGDGPAEARASAPTHADRGLPPFPLSGAPEDRSSRPPRHGCTAPCGPEPRGPPRCTSGGCA